MRGSKLRLLLLAPALVACDSGPPDTVTEMAERLSPVSVNVERAASSTTIVKWGDKVSMKYEFEGLDCSTGKRSFSDEASFCTGLRSRSLNNDCAPSMREDLWREHCLREFTQTE